MKCRFPINPLDTVSFVMGFNSTLAQIVLIRELITVARGNEFIIGFIYASWFCGISLGARWGSNAAESGLLRRVTSSLLLFPFMFLGAILFMYFSPLIIHRLPGSFYVFSMELLFSLVLTAPVSFLLGFFFPPCVTLLAASHDTHAGGRVYSLESLGSFIAAILFSVIMVELFNPLTVAGVMAALAFFTAIPMVTTKRIDMLLAFLGCMCTVFLFFTPGLERIIVQFAWNNSRPGLLLDYERSRYQFISLEESGGQLSLYGNGVLYGSYPDGYESRYPFHLIAALAGKENPSILLFGAGSGSLPIMLALGLDAKVTVIDIDPAIHGMLSRHLPSVYPGYSSDERIRYVTDDMRRYLNSAPEKYDVILSVLPPPHNEMINRYYTSDYFATCKKRLDRGGFLIIALPGFDSYIEDTQRAFIASIVRSYLQVFPHPIVAAGEMIYLAGGSDSDRHPPDAATLQRHYRRRFGTIKLEAIEKSLAQGLRPEELGLLFEKTQRNHFEQSIRPLFATVSPNTDARPEAFWHHLLHTSRQEGSLFYPLFRHFWIIIAAAAASVMAILMQTWRRNGTRQMAAGLLMGITGFVSITTVLLLILLYQNRYGHLYSRIALIQALTMGGLAAGSVSGSMMRPSALYGIFALLGLSASTIIVITYLPPEALFWILLLFISFLCGTVFSLLYRLICSGSHLAAAATLDSMDFVGALCGSLIATVLIPALGITAVSLICAILCLSAIPVCIYILKTS